MSDELYIFLVAVSAFGAGYASRALKPLLGGGADHVREKPIYITPAIARDTSESRRSRKSR